MSLRCQNILIFLVVLMGLIYLAKIRWNLIERNANMISIISAISGIVAAIALVLGLIYWFWTEQERDNQRYYVAWTEISSAPHAPITNSPTIPLQLDTKNRVPRDNKSGVPPCGDPSKRIGDSGRIFALEDLNNSERSLAGAPLSYAVIPFVRLEEANLDRIDLRHADLFGAHLDGADLWGSLLQHVNLSFAHLEGAHMVYAKLENACLQGAHLSQKTIEPMIPFLISINGKNFHLKTEVKNGHVVVRAPWPFSLVYSWLSNWELYFYYPYEHSQDNMTFSG